MSRPYRRRGSEKTLGCGFGRRGDLLLVPERGDEEFAETLRSNFRAVTEAVNERVKGVLAVGGSGGLEDPTLVIEPDSFPSARQ